MFNRRDPQARMTVADPPRQTPRSKPSFHVSLLAVGTVAFDVIETPTLAAERVQGGSASYVTLAARFFSDPVSLVAIVGGDYPDEYLARLSSRGIDLAGLQVDPSGKSFAWGVRYLEDMNRRETLFTHLNVLESFDPVVPPGARRARVVCLGNLDPRIQARVLDQVEEPDFVVGDTMNFWIDNTRAELLALLPRLDCLVVSEEEARQLSGERGILAAARRLRGLGPRIVVIKKGEHGAVLFDEAGPLLVGAWPVEDLRDPTGAGDAFLGGFAGTLACEAAAGRETLARAMVSGTVLASFVVERVGVGRLLDLTERDIETRARAFGALSALPPLVFPWSAAP